MPLRACGCARGSTRTHSSALLYAPKSRRLGRSTDIPTEWIYPPKCTGMDHIQSSECVCVWFVDEKIHTGVDSGRPNHTVSPMAGWGRQSAQVSARNVIH